ncbi:MAG: hypothetical protein JWO95_1295 [Verrucomicrobiales bacterium]|nr:hypothetical protein [Verrucomicrobiales bacterium]
MKLKQSLFVWCDFGGAYNGIFDYAADGHNEFRICNFAGAQIPMGEWRNVSFVHCNFANAELWQPFIGTNTTLFCCNLYNAKTSSPDFIKWAHGQRLVFTNVTSLDTWRYCVTNVLHYEQGGPQFMEWASNQFNTYINTNDTKAWLAWSKANLQP